MLNIKNNPKAFVMLALGGALMGIMLYGCSSSHEATTAPGVAPATQPASFALFGPAPKKTGVQLWSDNCMRCHNGRSPETFSDAQWDVIVHHMRLRANLTGEESREIVKFLQASN